MSYLKYDELENFRDFMDYIQGFGEEKSIEDLEYERQEEERINNPERYYGIEGWF